MTSKIIWGDSPLVMSEIPYTTFLGQAHVMTISPGERAEWVGKIFFAHWLQRFVIFSLALLFIIGPLSQNWKVWQPLCCWLEKTLCMFDYQDKKFCESTIYFFIAKTWENFRPSGILHLEYLLLLHVSSTSPWALTNLRSWPSLLASVRDQPPEIKIETLRERTNYI